MIKKLPYYMVYQEPFGVDDVRKAREDYDYMKSIYPDAAKRLVPFVEEECDRLMYDGSMIYDEYPDQLQLRLMCKRVYDRAKEGEENPGKWLKDLTSGDGLPGVVSEAGGTQKIPEDILHGRLGSPFPVDVPGKI